MEHKAFVFDYAGFYDELYGILLAGLRFGSVAGLRDFISGNLNALKDPYEGKPLCGDWERMIEFPDVHQYGDFALTKYYNPSEDIGLGHRWEHFQDLFGALGGLGWSPVLGEAIGPEENYFDPGKLGSYFQTPSQVNENLTRLLSLPEAMDLVTMLNRAAACEKGLYLTF